MALITLNGLSRFWSKVKQRIDEKASADLSDVTKSDFAKKMTESGEAIMVSASSTDGSAYTATVPGVTTLYNGLRITIIPSRTSSTTSPTLNVNGLGAKSIRLPMSINNASSTTPKLATFYSSGKPILLVFDSDQNMWKAAEKLRVSAQDLYGVTPIESGGTGASTASAALDSLGAASLAYVNTKIAELSERITALENA